MGRDEGRRTRDERGPAGAIDWDTHVPHAFDHCRGPCGGAAPRNGLDSDDRPRLGGRRLRVAPGGDAVSTIETRAVPGPPVQPRFNRWHAEIADQDTPIPVSRAVLRRARVRRHDPDASWPRRFRRRVRRVVRLHSSSAVGWRRARDRRCGTGADVPAQTVMGDPTRLVLGGMSRGGFLSVVYPSVHPVNARGIINFSGGWAADWCNTAFNEEMFGRAGRATLPMLWLYTENDRNYGPASIRAYHRAFTSAGGSAQLQLYPPIGSDGHDLLLRSVMVWQPAVDDFVKRIGLPTSSVSPASLLGARCRTAPENRRHTNDGCRRTGAIRQATEQGTPSTCQRQRQPAPRTAGIESSPIPNALGVVA